MKIEKVRKAFLVVAWICLIVLVFIKRESITLDAIVNYTPKSIFLAFLIMLLLFFIKSVAIFIYVGILYAASGVIFSLPLAICANALGSIIMCTVPFFIGKKAGSNIIKSLFKKYPKLKIIKEFQDKNEFFVSFFTRVVGILPFDIVSMYMGASLTNYSKYIVGSTIGMLPSAISFAIMGTSVDDPTSPSFILAAAFELVLMITSVVYLFVLNKRSKVK